MLDAIVARPVHTVPDVLGVMEAIDQALADTDGLKWFNRLYLRVTAAVAADLAVSPATTTGRVFLERLDVEFARLYFDAVRASLADPQAAPPAWRPLFAARSHALERVQFALAGMNAHINRDLPEALVRTFEALRASPQRGDERHAAFKAVDALLTRVEAAAKADWMLHPLIAHVDRKAGDLDDRAGMCSVSAARDAAWTHGEVLWALRPLPTLRREFFAKLDRLTGFAGRGLLVPTLRS